MHQVYLQLTLPVLTGSGTQAWVHNIGNMLIKEVQVEVGGQLIDRHYGQWLHIWSELTTPKGLEDTYNVMIGNTTTLTTEASSIPSTNLTIPLQFWFNRNAGLALPLIALQYHEVKINLELRPFSDLYVSSSGTVVVPTLPNASLYVDYIYLDTDERRQFAQIAHEYLIEQLQFTGQESFATTNVRQKLNYNHPVKALYWVAQLDANVDSGVNRLSDFTDNGAGSNPFNGNDPVSDAKLQLNGHDRFSVRNASYFNLVQPFQHHSRGPSTGIYVYSFANRPEEHQPSGSVNMSRIDNATLQLTMTSSASFKLYTYGINYNIFRIMSGMGGVAYSN
jgi:hypothetical protein